MRASVVVAVFVAVSAVAGARPARACDRILLPAATFATWPRDGAREVPLNVTPFVSMADMTLVTDAGDPVDVDVNALDLAGEFGAPSPFFRLVPRAALEPGAVYRLKDSSGAEIAVFSTGGDVDDEAPAAPDAAVTDVVAGNDDNTGFECAFEGNATVVVSGEPDVMVVAAYGEDVGFDAVFRGAALTDTLVLFSDEEVTAHVAVVDAAGNVSPSTTVALAIPAPAAGCASNATPQTTLALFALVAVLLPRKRNRARAVEAGRGRRER